MWVIIGGCMGNNRWKCVKASSQCVKLYTVIDYLTGNLHDLLSLPQIVGQYFADELS